MRYEIIEKSSPLKGKMKYGKYADLYLLELKQGYKKEDVKRIDGKAVKKIIISYEKLHKGKTKRSIYKVKLEFLEKIKKCLPIKKGDTFENEERTMIILENNKSIRIALINPVTKDKVYIEMGLPHFIDVIERYEKVKHKNYDIEKLRWEFYIRKK